MFKDTVPGLIMSAMNRSISLKGDLDDSDDDSGQPSLHPVKVDPLGVVVVAAVPNSTGCKS